MVSSLCTEVGVSRLDRSRRLDSGSWPRRVRVRLWFRQPVMVTDGALVVAHGVEVRWRSVPLSARRPALLAILGRTVSLCTGNAGLACAGSVPVVMARRTALVRGGWECAGLVLVVPQHQLVKSRRDQALISPMRKAAATGKYRRLQVLCAAKASDYECCR